MSIIFHAILPSNFQSRPSKNFSVACQLIPNEDCIIVDYSSIIEFFIREWLHFQKECHLKTHRDKCTKAITYNSSKEVI